MLPMESSAPIVSSCSPSSMGEQCDRGSGVANRELYDLPNNDNIEEVQSAPLLRRSKR